MSDIITTLSNTKCFSPNIQIRKRMMVCLTIIVDPWHNPPSHEGSSQEQCRWKKEMISNNMAKPFILSTILTHLSIANVWNVAVIGTQIDKWWWYQFPPLKCRCQYSNWQILMILIFTREMDVSTLMLTNIDDLIFTSEMEVDKY